MAICLLFIFTQLIAKNTSNDRLSIPVTDVIIDQIDITEKKKPEPIPLPPPAAKAPAIKTIRFVTPIIVADDIVKEPLPETNEIAEAKISTMTQDGTIDDTYVSPPVETGTGKVASLPKEEKDFDKDFTKIEKEARFPGGLDGWKKYLERNLNSNIAADEGAAVGNYLVKVQFFVDRDGTISNVLALEIPKACPGCGAEAVRVIKKGPKWEPAIQNGNTVKFPAVQYITFRVAEG